jgi:hypothetical protein
MNYSKRISFRIYYQSKNVPQRKKNGGLDVRREVGEKGGGTSFPMVSGLVNGVGVSGGTHYATELAPIARGVQVFGLHMTLHPLAGGTLVTAPGGGAAQLTLSQFDYHRIYQVLQLD